MLCRVTGYLAALSFALAACVGHAQVMIEGGTIENADIRYPQTDPLPNCLDLVFYGTDLDPECVRSVWNTDILLRSDPDVQDPIGLEWGSAAEIFVTQDNDPNSETFGLDCLVVRYKGPERPDLVGRLVHVGASIVPGKAVVKTEIWWTRENPTGGPAIRLRRPCDPRITWICRDNTWIVCVENNTSEPMYLYGCRFFGFPAGADVDILPQLEDLTFPNLDPMQFGTEWVNVPLPDQGVIPDLGFDLAPGFYCLRPKCRIYLPVTVTRWFPIVFQLAARNSPEDLQLPPPFLPENGPNPSDFVLEPGSPDGGVGTIFIGQSRPSLSFQSDLNGDGVVNIMDALELGREFNSVSPDAAVPMPMIQDR